MSLLLALLLFAWPARADPVSGAIFAWAVGAFGITSATVAAVVATTIEAFVYIGGTLLLNKAISTLTKKPKRSGPGLEFNFSGTLEPRRLIAGTLKVGGMHNIPPINTNKSGYPAKGQFGHDIIVHAGHEVHDITDVYFDQDLIADGAIGAVTGTADDGLVSTGKYANRTRIRRYLGTSTQTADYILTQALPSAFTSAFRGRGVAYTAVENWYDDKVFRSGWPNITALVMGQKLYDPRLDSTKPGGSGSHREDDPTTWAFTGGIGANPALYLRHFLTNEVGFSHAEMDDAFVMAAANICDGAVAIPGSLTQARYTFNHLMLATEPWEETLRVIVDSMRGHAAYVDGKWLMWAGNWETPSVTIQQGDWVAPMVVQASANRDERYNRVTGWYVDPDRNWQRMPCYPQRDSNYEAEDGGEVIPLDVELPGCASSAGTKYAEYEAQRHCKFLLRMSRNQIKVSGKLRPEFMRLIPGTTVYVTDPVFAWDSKTFRVIAVEAGVDGAGVDVALREEGAATWTDLAAGDYSTEAVGPSIDPSVTLPDLTADPAVTIGATTITFDVSSGVPSYQPVNTDYVVIAHSVGTPATAGSEVFRGRSPVAVVARSDVNTLYYWMRAEVSTYKSDYRPNTLGIPAAPYNEIAEYVNDPNFERSTSVNSLWRFYDVTRDMIQTGSSRIVGSGGVVGGYFQWNAISTPSFIVGLSPRAPLPIRGGDLIETTLRWRKVNTNTTFTNSYPYVIAQVMLVGSVYTYPHSNWGADASDQLTIQPVGGDRLRGFHISSAQAGVWQTTRIMHRVTEAHSIYKHMALSFNFQTNSRVKVSDEVLLQFDRISQRSFSQEAAGIAPLTSVSAAYVATRSDVGGQVKITTGGVTVNAGVFSEGDIAIYYNHSGSTQNITAGAGVTFRLGGTTTTGSPRTMAVYGTVMLRCIGLDEFVLTGDVS